MGAHLEALGNRRQSQLRGHGAAVPFHKRCADFENFIAIHTNHLSHLTIIIGIGVIIFQVLANIHLPEEGAFRHDREGPVDSRSRNRIVNRPSVIEQLFGSKMLFLSKCCLENGESLIRHAQAFGRKVGFEFFTRSVVTHTLNFELPSRRVKDARGKVKLPTGATKPRKQHEMPQADFAHGTHRKHGTNSAQRRNIKALGGRSQFFRVFGVFRGPIALDSSRVFSGVSWAILIPVCIVRGLYP